MAGIMDKIQEKLHIGGGGPKEGDHKDDHNKHKSESHEHDKKVGHPSGEHKEGIVDKIKDKIHGGGESGEHHKDGEKKKKKEKKKKHGEGKEHHGDSSSSSDSD